jgi:hypothetical protein
VTPDAGFGVYFGHGDHRNRDGLSLDGPCVHAANGTRGELAEVLAGDVSVRAEPLSG